MRVFITHSWTRFNKVPAAFNLNNTIELGLSFKKIKVLKSDITSIKKPNQINISKVSSRYYFTLSLLFFKIVIKFN